jgi:hypothetical protein
MKNILVLSIFLFMSLQSCHSQTFDLSVLQFPVAKSSLEKYKLEDQKIQLGTKYELFNSSNPDLMYFSKAKLSGKNAKGTSSENTNSVTFYNQENENKIYGYQIQTFTTAESNKLLTALIAMLGNPRFDYKKDDRFRIWETADKKVIYLFEYSTPDGNADAESELKVLHTGADDLVNYFLGGGFMYYKDYLLARAKKTGVYTYTDFLKEKKAENRLYYLEKSNTIK